MTTRGKTIVIGKQQRHFPAIARNPGGALDSALEREPDDDDKLKREAALDAREAALDWREAAEDEGKEDAECMDRKRARDARAVARDKRAHDRRAGGAHDEELPSREEAYRQARDAEVDHRHDFASIASGGPDRRGADSRGGMAHDKRARAAAAVDLGAIFALDQHPHAHHDA